MCTARAVTRSTTFSPPRRNRCVPSPGWRSPASGLSPTPSACIAEPTSPCMRRMRSQCSASDSVESEKGIAVPARARTTAASSERARSCIGRRSVCALTSGDLHTSSTNVRVLPAESAKPLERGERDVELARGAFAKAEALHAVGLVRRVVGVVLQSEAADDRRGCRVPANSATTGIEPPVRTNAVGAPPARSSACARSCDRRVVGREERRLGAGAVSSSSAPSGSAPRSRRSSVAARACAFWPGARRSETRRVRRRRAPPCGARRRGWR